MNAHTRWDCHLATPDAVHAAGDRGWTGACLVIPLDSPNGYTKRLNEHKKALSSAPLDLLYGAKIAGVKPAHIQKTARNALDAGADLVYFTATNLDDNRHASECWEIDVICDPHHTAERDFMDQRAAGIDPVIAKNMAERGMALEVSFASLLSCWGRKRADALARIRQNLMLAKKHGVPVIATSGASTPRATRSPHDCRSLLRIIGACEKQAKDAISLHPQRLIQKARDRNDPDVLLSGLEVVDWGDQDPPQHKRKYGWY